MLFNNFIYSLCHCSAWKVSCISKEIRLFPSENRTKAKKVKVTMESQQSRAWNRIEAGSQLLPAGISDCPAPAKSSRNEHPAILRNTSQSSPHPLQHSSYLRCSIPLRSNTCSVDQYISTHTSCILLIPSSLLPFQSQPWIKTNSAAAPMTTSSRTTSSQSRSPLA